MDTGMLKGFDVPKLDPADIASLALDGMAADEYEIIADDLSRQVHAVGSARAQTQYQGVLDLRPRAA
jgi:hypothetical protein